MDVFAVGDDDQVIYGYAGADPGFLIDFERLFPGAGSHALEVNYRCPADVVDAASTLLAYNERRVEKTIRAASLSSGLHVVAVPGDELGAHAVGRVEDLLREGTDPAAIAVLSRVNSTLLPAHIALSLKAIPFQSPLGPSALDRTSIRAALAWIRVAVDPEHMSRSDLFEIVRRPGRGITRLFTQTLSRRVGPIALHDLARLGESVDGRPGERWQQLCDDIRHAARCASTTPGLLDVLITEIGLDRAAAALDAGRSRADRGGQGDDLTALRRAAALGPAPDRFESWLREHLAVPGEGGGGVTLSTVHRVKGLEWDHVLVFGVDRGTMPHALSEDVEEERRVFHVAMTRGRRTVTLLVDEARPSRFLSEIEGTASRDPEPPPPVAQTPARIPRDAVFVVPGDELVLAGGYRGAVSEVLTTGVLVRLSGTDTVMSVPFGEKVTRGDVSGPVAPGGGSPDSALVERLKAWRLAQARSQGVPAYVVFSDRTLEALIALRPDTEEALLRVPGIGPAKLEAYGDQILALVTDVPPHA